MRNIEVIAEEEELKDRETRWRRLRFLSLAAGAGLALWGWVLFRQGDMGKGALAVVAGLALAALAWGCARFFRPQGFASLAGLLAGALPLALYSETRLPAFTWGKDPAFWLSVHGGAVGAPAWSPLSYLLDQALCFLLPGRRFSLLPEVSAVVLAAAFYFLLLDYFSRFKNKTVTAMLLALLASWLLALSLPFWSAGTLGSGLVAGLGFLLFLLQRSLLEQEERPWKALYFLLGLLWSVHPLWGLLGTVRFVASLDYQGRRIKPHLLPFLAGGTPFLWLWFRAGAFFPSWGGDHPFHEMLKTPWLPEGPLGGSLGAAVSGMGWLLAVLALVAAVLLPLYVLKWRGGAGRHLIHPLDFWIWMLSGAGAVLYFSPGDRALGPTALWFAAELGGLCLKLLERGMEKRQPVFASGARLAWGAEALFLLSLGLAWLPGQQCLRSRVYFPLQHAVNLLEGLGPKSLLVCRDPFEAAACREARLIDPIARGAVILEEPYLDRRWYVAQCIQHAPDLLFSTVQGPADMVLKSLVLDNRDAWDIQWDVPQLPGGWDGISTEPTILTRRFLGSANASIDPAENQYRYDLTVLPPAGARMSPESARHRSLYVTGFYELGRFLRGQQRYSAAIHAFERAAKLDPDYAAPRQALQDMYSRQNILEAAELEFEKIVKTHPGRIAAVEKALEAAEQAKDEARTVELLDKMVHLNTELADAQYQLSRIYEKEGKTREAKALLESSVQLNPKQMDAQMTLGRLMAHLGNRIQAEEAFRAVLVMDPQNKQAQMAIWKLLNKP